MSIKRTTTHVFASAQASNEGSVEVMVNGAFSDMTIDEAFAFAREVTDAATEAAEYIAEGSADVNVPSARHSSLQSDEKTPEAQSPDLDQKTPENAAERCAAKTGVEQCQLQAGHNGFHDVGAFKWGFVR